VIAHDRLAGAPISWGVCEVPGWGHEIAPERVLAEMRELGLRATELGPPGYLPAEPSRLRALLDEAELRLAAGFLAVVLHEPERRAAATEEIARQAITLAAAGADLLILAAALPGEGYDGRTRLSDTGWAELAGALASAEEVAAAHGLELAFHPHVGTAVERVEEVTTLLERTDAAICLDTGHLMLGGADPGQVAALAGSRVRLVHLKDVDGTLAARFQAGELSYTDAVRSGLYLPLGRGAAGITAVLRHLEDVAYQGWYVLEQDVALSGEPEAGEGPIAAVRQSLEFLRGRERRGRERRGKEEEDGHEELAPGRRGSDRDPSSRRL
jgi:inosose dehydratase